MTKSTTSEQDKKLNVQQEEFKYHNLKETINFIVGTMVFVFTLPMIGVVATFSFFWDLIDRCLVGKFSLFGDAATGLCSVMGRKISDRFYEQSIKVMKYKEDAFMVIYFVFFAIFLPLLFLGNLIYTYYFGFSLVACLVYNVIRVGPYMINFAYLYTMCHKEGHQGTDLYNKKFHFLNGIFNYWIGLFYGVLPSVFFYGHTYNHHKYNNGKMDIITTSDRPRDSVVNFLKYLTRFSLFSINITTIMQFYEEKKMKAVLTITFGTIYYFTFLAIIAKIDLVFAFGYVFYPLLEQNLFLSTTAWTWHAFLDKNDPDGNYGNGVTIQEGLFNVLNEDFHVVHHQYPALHWSRYPDLYEQDKDLYVKHNSFTIKNVHQFSLFALIIFRQYKWMASLLISQNGTLKTMDEKVEFIKDRVRACSWGPLQNCTPLEIKKE